MEIISQPGRAFAEANAFLNPMSGTKKKIVRSNTVSDIIHKLTASSYSLRYITGAI